MFVGLEKNLWSKANVNFLDCCAILSQESCDSADDSRLAFARRDRQQDFLVVREEHRSNDRTRKLTEAWEKAKICKKNLLPFIHTMCLLKIVMLKSHLSSSVSGLQAVGIYNLLKPAIKRSIVWELDLFHLLNLLLRDVLPKHLQRLLTLSMYRLLRDTKVIVQKGHRLLILLAEHVLEFLMELLSLNYCLLFRFGMDKFSYHLCSALYSWCHYLYHFVSAFEYRSDWLHRQRLDWLELLGWLFWWVNLLHWRVNSISASEYRSDWLHRRRLDWLELMG